MMIPPQKATGLVTDLGNRTNINSRVVKRTGCKVRKEDNSVENLTEFYMSPSGDNALQLAKKSGDKTFVYYVPLQLKKKLVRNMLFAVVCQRPNGRLSVHVSDLKIDSERDTLNSSAQKSLLLFKGMIGAGIILVLTAVATMGIGLLIGLPFIFVGYMALKETKANIERYKQIPDDALLESCLLKDFPSLKQAVAAR